MNSDNNLNSIEQPGQNQETANQAAPAYYHGQQGNIYNSGGQTGTEKRFRPRTILIPLGFMLLHFLVINVVAVLFMLVIIIAGSVGSLDPSLFNDPAYLNQLIIERNSQITVVYGLAVLPIYLLYLHFARRRRPDAVYLEKTGILDILPSLAIMTGVMGLTNLYFILLEWLAEKSVLIERLMSDYKELSTMAFSTENDYIWLILGIGIAAPVVEELLFRGIIQGELRRAMPEWLAVVIQAVLFAIFHMQPVQSTYVLLPGLLLGAAYAWTRSLWVPIIMHVFFNLLGSLVPSLIQSDEMLQQITVISEMAFIPVAIAAIFYMYLKHKKKNAMKKSGGDTNYEPAI